MVQAMCVKIDKKCHSKADDNPKVERYKQRRDTIYPNILLFDLCEMVDIFIHPITGEQRKNENWELN